MVSKNIHYAILNRLVRTFTCVGMLPHQYINFSAFAGIRTVGMWYMYIRKGINQIHVLQACTCIILTICFSVQGQWLRGDGGSCNRAVHGEGSERGD